MAKTYRNGRANLVSWAIEGHFGWSRDPRAVGAGPTWDYRFPNLPFVRDGREETGNTRAGRGTTAFDLFRQVETSGYLRTDFLSIKTEAIAADGKLPSKLDLSTGNVGTLDALLEGINNGVALPTVVFASENDENGDAVPDGLALVLDLGPVLRGEIPFAPEGGFGKGEAPDAYFRWSSARSSGKAGKHFAREEWSFPCVDEQGRRWVAPDRVQYSELVCSLSSLGIRRGDWTPVHVNQLPAFVETMNWSEMSL